MTSAPTTQSQAHGDLDNQHGTTTAMGLQHELRKLLLISLAIKIKPHNIHGKKIAAERLLVSHGANKDNRNANSCQ